MIMNPILAFTYCTQYNNSLLRGWEGEMTIHKEFRPWHILYSLYIRMQDDANHSQPQGQCNVFLVANLSSPQFPWWKHCLAWDSSQGKSVCLILKGSNGWNGRFWDLCSRIGLSFLVKNVKGRCPNSKRLIVYIDLEPFQTELISSWWNRSHAPPYSDACSWLVEHAMNRI